MSIITITIIEPTDFIEFQPNAESKYTTEEITSAINLSHTLLDAEVGGAITDRWSKTSTEEGYLTDTQKLHIKKAYLIETQYVLMNGLDFSQGTDQFSLGSFNMSSNRPNRNLISPQALKELQLAGIWYQTDFVQARNGANCASLADSMNEPLWNDEPLSETTSDARYIHKVAETDGSYSKFIKYDSQGVVEYVPITATVAQQKETATPAYYLTIGDVEYKLGGNAHTRYIELYGYSGTITDEQLSILVENSTNFIWWANDSTSDDGVFLTPTYWEPGVNATYEKVLTQTNYKLSLDIVNKTWTMVEKPLQQKVYYGATAPSNPQDNDIWVQESIGSTSVQVQSDWTQTDTTAVDYIKNKPVEKHLYQHFLHINGTAVSGTYTGYNFNIWLVIYNNSITDLTENDIVTYITENKIITSSGFVSNTNTSPTNVYPVMVAAYNGGGSLYWDISFAIPNTSYGNGTIPLLNDGSNWNIISQKVIQIF